MEYAVLQLVSLVLLVYLVIQSAAEMFTTEIREKIEEFNQLSEVKTNIFIYNNGEINIGDYIPKDTSVILVNRLQTNFKLIYEVNKNALAIVLLSERNNFGLLNIMNELLTRLRQIKVLLILPTTRSDKESQLALFRSAWQSGYTRIMSLHATPSANGTQIQLMSFSPFPELHLISVEQPADYFRYILPHDFQGHPIRTPLGQNAPVVFSYNDGDGQRKTSGMMYYVFNNFIKLHNATLEEVVLPAPYPELVAIDSVIKAMQHGQLDISLHLYFADYEKWHINQPPFLFPHYFRVPNAKLRPFKDYIWAPFERRVWYAVFLYLLFITLILTFGNFVSARIEWLRGKPKRENISRVGSEITSSDGPRSGGTSKFKQNLKSYSSNFYTHLLASLCFTPNSRYQRSYYKLRLNCIFMFHSVFAFILVNYYNALSVSFLTTGIYEPQLNSIADVIRSPYKILLTYSDIPYFANDSELRRKVEIISGSEMTQHHLTLNDSVILLKTLWTYDFFGSQQMNLLQKRVRLLTSEIIWDVLCGMLMPLNSPYVEMLTDTLLWSFNTGLFRKAYFDTRWDGYRSGILNKLPRDRESGFVLDLDYFYWAWGVCIFGYILSALILLAERFCYKKTKRNASG